MSYTRIFTPFLLAALFFISSGTTLSAQCFDSKGQHVERIISPGSGQEFSGGFIPIEDFHFVQFAVYSGDKTIVDIRPPKGIGQVWLIAHAETIIRQKSRQTGALYVVKPFPSAEAAKAAARKYNKKGLESWYNPELTNSVFSLVGATQSILD